MQENKPAHEADTIFALASALGRAGVAVFRISGPLADEALRKLSGQELPAERHAELRTLFGIMNGDMIDDVLVLRFVAPRSYTGENVVELQTHGGRAIISAVLAALGRLPGLRPAKPGEFTRRAVENGRLDLTQAEAIVDLVDAETEAQRRQALSQLQGQLGRLYEDWRVRLIRAAAWLEGAIDFPDDEVPEAAIAESRATVETVHQEIRAHLADGRQGEIMREGLYVAVIGPPNAGKSSLVNALAQRDVAIVSAVPGTTRDVIEVRLDLKGYPVILADTAGLREVSDTIEAEGVRRAEARARAADLRLLVLDGSSRDPLVGLAPEILAQAEITVWNKSDLRGPERDGTKISVLTNHGLQNLINILAEKAQRILENNSDAPVLTRARHRNALKIADKALEKANKSYKNPELAAEDVRLALRAIGGITGRVDLEELLDVVFRDFCIGK